MIKLWDSTISFDDFIGNDVVVSKLVAWLGEFFHPVCTAGLNSTTKSHAIIVGKSGNGKTSLVYALANGFHVPILHITPDDVKTKEQLNRFKKELNTIPLNSNTEHKIVLIDDIEDYPKSNKDLDKIDLDEVVVREQLIKNFIEISNHPIIYTTSNINVLPSDFKESGEVCKLVKPTQKELKQLLLEKAEGYGVTIKPSDLQNILSNAPSVRSALNSIFSTDYSLILKTEFNIFEKIRNVRDAQLQEPLDNYTLKILLNNCKEIKDVRYLSRLVILSDKNFHSDTHPYLLNTKNFKISGRIEFFSVKNNKYYLNKEEKQLIKQLHISSRIFKTEYKFLNVEAKEDLIKKESKKKQKEKELIGLGEFF